jgi:hypothetical protein
MFALSACSDIVPRSGPTAPDLAPSLDGAAPADVGAQQLPTRGSASGHAEVRTFFTQSFADKYSFNAHSIPMGFVQLGPRGVFFEAKGEFHGTRELIVGGVVTEQVTFDADIDCLIISENTAILSGPVRRRRIGNQEDTPFGLFLVFVVRDNGEGANSPPDEAALWRFDSGFPNQRICLTASLPPTRNDGRANIQVRSSGP